MTQRDEREKLAAVLSKIEFALRKDSLTAQERIADARTIVCAEISQLEYRTPAPADGDAHAEIQRLQEAKRRALALADERAKENVALRAALAGPASEGVRWQPIATVPKNELIDVWTVGWGAEPHRVADCYYDQICGEWRTSRPAGQLLCIKERYITHWMSRPTAPEPADTPDEGPDPLGYAKGER